MKIKPKKHTLEFDDSEEFEVLAVCSHLPDYRLVWTINKYADLELTRGEDLFPNFSKKGELISNHVQYSFHDEFHEVQYLLLKNKELRSYLIPELELVDYLLFITTMHQYPTDHIRQKLIESEAIIAVYKIDSSQINAVSRIEVFN